MSNKPTILVGNSFCEIQGFDSSTLEYLAEELTYTDESKLHEIRQLTDLAWKTRAALNKTKNPMARKALHRKSFGLEAKIRYLQEEVDQCLLHDRAFPTGLLDLVIDVLTKDKVSIEVKDKRAIPNYDLNFSWVGATKDARPYQLEAIDIAVEKHRGVIRSCVGSGKTYMIQKVIQKLGVRSIVVSPAVDLCLQLYYDFVEAFGREIVGIVESYSTASSEELAKPILVTSIHTLNSAKEKEEEHILLQDKDLLYLDEIHHAASDTYLNLLPSTDHIYYRFGGTGTFLRNDSKTMALYGVLSDVLFSYSAIQAFQDGYAVPFDVKIYDIVGKAKNKYASEYNANYCGKSPVLTQIRKILGGIKEDEQVLILVGRKEKGGKIIHEYLKHFGIQSLFISGDDKKTKVKQAIADFNEKRIRILIGSTIIGEGINVCSTDHLIMAQGGKSKIAIPQAIGRLIRLYPGKVKGRLHDFNFMGTKYLQKHLLDRIEVYEKDFEADIEIVE